MNENIVAGIKNRLLQHLARFLPGASSVRVILHRWRGVKIGKGAWIGYDAILETAHPGWIYIGNNVTIGIRSTILAHLWKSYLPEKGKEKEFTTVRIEDKAHIGSGSLILPNVTIGYGAVVSAGSVVTRSVPSMTMVQGNPARPVATCGIPLMEETPIDEFVRNLKPKKKRRKTHKE